MMTDAQAIALGLVQGLTEYLPVSSSAHLVIVPDLLGWQFSSKEAFIFDVLVQLGTLVGLTAFFFRPLVDVGTSIVVGIVTLKPFYNEEARLGWLVALATIPAVIFGLCFKQQIAQYFFSPVVSGYFLLFTGLLLFLTEYFSLSQKSMPSRSDAIFIGLAQSLALLPGVSRSGATIGAGMIAGLSRKNAAQFSFLMSMPIMIGASSLAVADLARDTDLLFEMARPLVLGFLSAAITGYFVIKWFMKFLGNQRLTWFAAYCVCAGLAAIVILGSS